MTSLFKTDLLKKSQNQFYLTFTQIFLEKKRKIV